MTVEEWDACTTKPVLMFRQARAKLSSRKLQLIACGFCRLLPTDHCEPWISDALIAAEQLFEEQLSTQQYQQAILRFREQMKQYTSQTMGHHPAFPSATAVDLACNSSNLHEAIPAIRAIVTEHYESFSKAGKESAARKTIISKQCHVLRDIIEYPPLVYRQFFAPGPNRHRGFFEPGQGFFTVHESLQNIATAIDVEKAFDRLPILADALEDDGLTDERMLNHLRGPGPHFRGCWALDAVLGKS